MLSAVSLAVFAQADGVGIVEGNVRFDASSPQPAAIQYRTRTRTPILPADGARAIVWLTRKDEESPAVIFDRPGVVMIYCEIHRHMRSILLVLETPWFTVTDEAGHRPSIGACGQTCERLQTNHHRPGSDLRASSTATLSRNHAQHLRGATGG